MDVTAVLWGVAAVLLSCVYVARFWLQKAKLHSQINKLPGPPAYPIIGTTYWFFGAPRHRLLNIMMDISTKYGPIFRTWLGCSPEVVLTKPQHFEAILNGTKHLEKSSSCRFMKPLLGSGLVTSTGCPLFVASDEADIATAFRQEVAHIAGSHAADGIYRLPHRFQRTVDNLGDYFEGC